SCKIFWTATTLNAPRTIRPWRGDTSSLPSSVGSPPTAKLGRHGAAIASTSEFAKRPSAGGGMSDDPNSPTLFDDADDEARLRRVAWECADAIWSVGRKNVRSYDIKNLMDDLIEWCKPRQLNGKQWTPEEQMRWLVRNVRDKGEVVSLKELRRMLLD